jgi:hypothetical protein
MVTAIRFYDATIAVALATMLAIVLALIAAVIAGASGPNVPVAIVVFVLAAPMLLLRLWRSWSTSPSAR